MNIDNRNYIKEHEYSIKENTLLYTAPILYNYVIWILKKSIEIGVEDLYFLSRDGQILYHMAHILIEKLRLNINVHYLYLSRYSLRQSLYYLDKELAIEYLFLNGAYVSVDIILDRVGFEKEEKQKILYELEISNVDSKRKLNKKEILDLKYKLINNIYFNEIALKHSKNYYTNIKEYFKQEGLYEQENIYIVDSGWMGSMQKTLYSILNYEGEHQLIGFYFGMFGKKPIGCGEFYTFYFDNKKYFKHKVFFCNNLFECMCMADHGMTLSYEKKGERIIPVLNNVFFKEYVMIQQKSIIEYCKNTNVKNINDYSEKILRKNTYKKIMSFMVFPTKEQIDTFGQIPFCDDITEKYFFTLIPQSIDNSLYEDLIIKKIMNKIFLKKQNNSNKEIYWKWGAISKIKSWKRVFYFLDNILLQSIRYIKI